MAHQLYVLQVLTFNLLEERMMTKMDPNDQVGAEWDELPGLHCVLLPTLGLCVEHVPCARGHAWSCLQTWFVSALGNRSVRLAVTSHSRVTLWAKSASVCYGRGAASSDPSGPESCPESLTSSFFSLVSCFTC